MFKKVFAISVIGLSFAVSAAEDSVCGQTTHGKPLGLVAKKVNLTDSQSFFREFGSALLETTRDGKKISVWFDILHTQAGSASASSRRDCGVMFAVTSDAGKTTNTMKSLGRTEIDDILKGQIPNF